MYNYQKRSVMPEVSSGTWEQIRFMEMISRADVIYPIDLSEETPDFRELYDQKAYDISGYIIKGFQTGQRITVGIFAMSPFFLFALRRKILREKKKGVFLVLAGLILTVILAGAINVVFCGWIQDGGYSMIFYSGGIIAVLCMIEVILFTAVINLILSGIGKRRMEPSCTSSESPAESAQANPPS